MTTVAEYDFVKISCRQILHFCLICVTYAHNPVISRLKSRKSGKACLYILILKLAGSHTVVLLIKNIHVYAVYLLVEDFCIIVSQITQGKAIDIIAVAMILLNAGCGE